VCRRFGALKDPKKILRIVYFSEYDMDEKHYLNEARVQHSLREVYDGEYTYHTKGGRHSKRKCVYQMIAYRM
jgi:hypothetical protein